MQKDTGLYVYGLIHTDKDMDFGQIGLEQDGKPGRVYTQREGTMAAVVSELAYCKKILPLRKNLVPHNAVIQEVMKTVTIVPVAFGHVGKNEKEITSMLRKNGDEIAEQLERVEGRVEMSLKVKWDVDNVFEHIVKHDSELAAFRDKLFCCSNNSSPADKIELGRMFEEKLDSEREELTDRVLDDFSSVACESCVNPLKNEKDVMNLVFLVDRKLLKSFEERIYQVAETFSGKYLFDYGGPFAPFHFIDLEFS
jgi:hypothetical protein